VHSEKTNLQNVKLFVTAFRSITLNITDCTGIVV